MAKGKYQPLFDLGEEAVLALERYVRQEVPKATIARKLHQAGQLKNIPVKKLARLIAGYEVDVMDRALMKRIDGTGLLEASRRAARLDVAEELMTAVAVQRERVDRAIDIGSKTPGLLVDQHGKEVERYVSILEKTAKIHMDLGIISKAPRRVTQTIMRDRNNPNRVMIEMTEETVGAADDVAKMFEGEFDVLALPAPADAAHA